MAAALRMVDGMMVVPVNQETTSLTHRSADHECFAHSTLYFAEWT